MIDRVTLRCGVASVDAVLDRLPPPTVETKPDGSTLWKGELGPFGYWLTERRLTLRGCLAVYASGVAPPKVVGVAAERLADALGLDMGAARITNMEVFADLHLAKPVCLYLPLLWALGRHKRLSVFDAERAGETLKFITKRRCLQFYDKGKQMGCSRSGGLLRVELSYKCGGVAEAFGKGLTLSHIAGRQFRSHVADGWSGWYSDVLKGRELRTDLGGRDFVRALAAERIYERGVGDVLAEIAAHRKAGVISKGAASDRRRDVLRIARDPRFTRPSPLLAELDSAVSEAARQMAA